LFALCTNLTDFIQSVNLINAQDLHIIRYGNNKFLGMVKEILDKWFSTIYEPNETDDACLRIIDEIENPS